MTEVSQDIRRQIVQTPSLISPAHDSHHKRTAVIIIVLAGLVVQDRLHAPQVDPIIGRALQKKLNSLPSLVQEVLIARLAGEMLGHPPFAASGHHDQHPVLLQHKGEEMLLHSFQIRLGIRLR